MGIKGHVRYTIAEKVWGVFCSPLPGRKLRLKQGLPLSHRELWLEHKCSVSLQSYYSVPLILPLDPTRKCFLKYQALWSYIRLKTQQGTLRASLTRALIEMVFRSKSSLTTAPQMPFFIMREHPCLQNSDSNN